MAKRSRDTIALTRCPECGHGGEGALQRRRITYRWIEGVEEERQFEAEIDAVCCAGCGARMLDEYARLQKHEAWCRATGMLGPRQIRRMRRRLDLTIEQFARLLGAGTASVGRWERGATVQNVGYDNLMRLLARRSNVVTLARRAGLVMPETAVTRIVRADGETGAWQPRFPSLQITPELQERARRFRPRKGVA
jgi:putative zinc finger/helix-turn-helix YgiT family protein